MLDIKLVRERQTNYPYVFDAINRKFLPKAGVRIKRAATDIVPVKDGGLKGSIRYKVMKDKVSIGTNLEYAPYVEYGTGRNAEGGKGKSSIQGMRARPYLRPALDSNRKFLVALWADTYNKVFRVLGGK